MGRHKENSREGEARARIQDLIGAWGGGHHPEIVSEIILNALKLLRDVEDRADTRLIQTTIRELRYACRLFDPYRDVRKVSIFGSARTEREKQEYRQAQEFGRKIVEAGYMVITGAGAGIMQAGHEGAGPEASFGANIFLPWEQAANPVIQKDKKLITFRYFFIRKLTFMRHSDAIVLFPGGFGTLDEGYEALTLMQTGKSRLRPLVLLDRPGGTYWKTWDRTVQDHLLRNGLISGEDQVLYQITDQVDQAVRWIKRFYRNFHSARFVKELYIIRLRHRPTASAIDGLNEDFSDLFESKPFHLIEATSEEQADQDVPELPRVAFGFNRRSYGRLRQLIDVLNSF